MESKHIKLNQEMGVLDIFKTTLLISSKNINFIIITFITSIPLFCFSLYHEFSLQKQLLETFKILKGSKGGFLFDVFGYPKKDYLHELTQMVFLYLVPFRLLQLSTVLLIVDFASKMYKEDKPMGLKDMVQKPLINMKRLRSTLIPFVYVTSLSTCTLLGLSWLVRVFSMDYNIYSVFPATVFGGAFVELLIIYSALSAVWNTSIVVSVLEGVYGTQALALSSYYSRGKDRCGIILMLVFFVWEIGLRFPCLYIGCYEGGYGIIAQVSLFCLGNALKWVVCVVYFHSCKKRTLEKKVDLEVGSRG